MLQPGDDVQAIRRRRADPVVEDKATVRAQLEAEMARFYAAGGAAQRVASGTTAEPRRLVTVQRYVEANEPTGKRMKLRKRRVWESPLAGTGLRLPNSGKSGGGK